MKFQILSRLALLGFTGLLSAGSGLATQSVLLSADVEHSRSPVIENDQPDKSSGILERIVIMGASASDGFMLPTKLDRAIAGIVQVEHEPILLLADKMFFQRPRHHSTTQLQRAFEARPTLIVAIDFLFWLGYGDLGGEDRRLPLMNWGLELLEKVECPIVLATLPDMRDASPWMLSAAQKPTVESLAQLNARIVEWAKDRPKVLLLSFDEMNEEWRQGRSVEIAGVSWPGESKLPVVQADKLHPTLAGLCGLACHIFESLVEAELIPAGAVRLSPTKLYDELHEDQMRQLSEKRAERRRKTKEKAANGGR